MEHLYPDPDHRFDSIWFTDCMMVSNNKILNSVDEKKFPSDFDILRK